MRKYNIEDLHGRCIIQKKKVHRHRKSQARKKTDEELGYVGPIKLTLLEPKEGYCWAALFSCLSGVCHILIGITVFFTIKPIISKALKDVSSLNFKDYHILLCTLGVLIFSYFILYLK